MGIGKRSRGILVTSLQPGSSAAVQLRVGDRLMAVNGVAISDQVQAPFFLRNHLISDVGRDPGEGVGRPPHPAGVPSAVLSGTMINVPSICPLHHHFKSFHELVLPSGYRRKKRQ
jgi:hypothetical protein